MLENVFVVPLVIIRPIVLHPLKIADLRNHKCHWD